MEEQNQTVQQPNSDQPVQPQQPQQSAPVEPVTPPDPNSTVQPIAQPQKPKPPVSNVPQEEKVWGLLAYLPLLALATLVLKPKSDFCRFHGAQGLVIFGLEFLMIFVSAISPTIGGLLLFVVLIIAVFGAVKAFMGEQFKIPVINEVAKLIPVDSLVAGVVGTEAMKKPEQSAQPPVDSATEAMTADAATSSAPEKPVDPPVEEVVSDVQPQTDQQSQPTPPPATIEVKPGIPNEPTQPSEAVPPVVPSSGAQVDGGDYSVSTDDVGSSDDTASSGE